MTHNTREWESRFDKLMDELPVNDYRVIHHDLITGLPRPTARGTVIKDFLHQELQKARHDWLREEIVWLKNERAHSFGETATTLETIIDRYQSELDQPTTPQTDVTKN